MPNDNWKYEKKEYWEERYASEESYDWCKKYDDIKHIMEHGIQKTDRILIIGCGNSTLSEDMYKDGYRNLVNMDYSSIVIQNMKSSLSETCPGIEWTIMDLRSLCFLPGSFDVVIEKATLDSLLVTEKDPWNITKNTQALFKSILSQMLMKAVLLLVHIFLSESTLLESLLQQKQSWSSSGGSDLTKFGVTPSVKVPESVSGPEFLYWMTHLSRNPDIIAQLIQKHEELTRTYGSTTGQHRTLLETIERLQSDYCPEGTRVYEDTCVSLIKRDIMSYYEAKLICHEKGGDMLSVHVTDLRKLLEALDVDPAIDITFYMDLDVKSGVFHLKDGTRAKFDSAIGLPREDYYGTSNCYKLAVWQHETKLKSTSCYYLKQPSTPVSYAVCQYPKLKGKSVNEYVEW